MSQDASARILNGPLPRELLRFGTPLALGMGLQTTFNLVDAYLIGRLSPDVAGPSLGAIGICDQLAALGTIVSYGVSVASASMVSKAWGAGDHDAARRIAWQSMLLVVGLGILAAVAGGIFARPLLSGLVGVKGRVAELGVPYLSLVMGGSITIFMVLHLASLLRAVGSSKTPASLLVLGNAVNLLFAVVLAYGPGQAPPIFAWGPPLAQALGIPRLELFGAGLATIAARALVLVPLGISVFVRFGFRLRWPWPRPHQPTLQAIIRQAWPASAELVVRMCAMLLTHSLVARAFTTPDNQDATTALGIVFRFETMALFVAMGWGSAAQTFVAQNLGADNPVRAKQSGYVAALYAALMLSVLSLFYVGRAPAIVGFFDESPRVMEIAQSYLRWVSPSYLALGFAIVLGSALQGAGAARKALLVDAAVVGLLQLPASLLVLLAPSPALSHVWIIAAATYFALALSFAVSYRRGSFAEGLDLATESQRRST